LENEALLSIWQAVGGGLLIPQTISDNGTWGE